MIRSRLILALAALAFAMVAKARGASAAESYVRAGDAQAALRALEKEELPAAERAYWKGRALVMLDRLEDAAESFYQVPKEHKLYPYAARGVLYCAWRSPKINFIEVAGPLTAAAEPELAMQALAALCEYQLRYTNDTDPATFLRLKEKAKDDSVLQPIVRLLELHLYRRSRDFAAGIEYARAMEQDSSLPLLMRQRVRLDLAELYYDKEKHTEAGAENAETNADEGKGEETLLQFITANPETPLLEEAFRRLYQHAGAAGSEYVRTKLHDWADDTMHPKRAALAFYTLLQMEPTHGADPATLVNRAAANLPGEPLTLTILQEHIRRLMLQGKTEEAGLYMTALINLQKTPDARTDFLKAWSMQPENAQTLSLFRRSAEAADGSLHTPALVNALICATLGNAPAEVESLLRSPDSSRAKGALLLAHAGLLLERDPARARQETTAAAELSPTPQQEVDICLDLAQLDLPQKPRETLNKLLAIPPAARNSWSVSQTLRYAALIEKAIDDLRAANPEQECAEDHLYSLYIESKNLAVKEGLALHLADRLTGDKRHREALDLLLDLAQLQPAGERKAATLLYAGYECSKQGSLAALEESVHLYAESAKQGSALSARATIEQAATLVRINRSKEALELLSHLQQASLSPARQAHMLTVLADAYGLDMTPESLATALSYCEKIAEIRGLPQAWLSRGYLQHASLCTRMGRNEDALADYQKALEIELPTANPQEPESCFVMYYAAAGAVYQLMQMERYEEAASLADATGAWPGTPKEPALTPGPKADAFIRWAQNIRQMHYLPMPVLEEEQAAAF